jgi:hypothetical protein
MELRRRARPAIPLFRNRDRNTAGPGGGAKAERFAAALLGLALLACLVRRTGVDIVVQQTKTVGWGMAVIIALGGISHLIRTWSWRLTFLCDLRQLSFGRTFALRLVSEGTGKLGIAGQVVGETTRVFLLGSSVPIANSLSSVTLDRGLYMLTSAMVSLAGIVSALLLISLSESWRLYLVLSASMLLLLLVVTVAAVQCRWPVLSRCAGMIAPAMVQSLANRQAVSNSLR